MSTKKTIARSFTVSTIEDGVSVQAQYAPNANPTSGQIHIVWQTGDLYMRTRESDDVAWSSWHKIVGESGGETDYQFALSANLVTQDGTSATAPSDISSSAWQDAPMATTTQKPYLWSKVQKKDGNGNNVGSATYIRLTGEEGKDGLSPNPNILLRTVFDSGIDKVKEKWEADWSYVGIDDASDTIVDGRKCIRINASSLSTYKDFSQDVYGKLKTSTWYTLSFDFFSTHNFTTFIWDGNNSSGIVDRTAGCYIDGVFQSLDLGIDGSHEWTAQWGNEKRHSISFKTKSSFGTAHAYILFRCPSGAQVAICMPKLELGENATTYIANEDDLEGDKGADAPYIELSRSAIFYTANSNGYSIASQNFAITYALKVRGNTCSIASVNDVSISLPSDVTVVSGTKTTSGCTINCTHSKIMRGVITITITGTYDGVTYTATGTITVDSSRQGEQGEKGEQGEQGETGARGKVGRFFYYAGELNDFASTDSFLVNDAQAPYFYYNNNYWVFNPETNGKYTKQNMGTPSSSSSNWKLMTSDFKYIITEAIFGAYAHFGSFIINGDWMISTNGTINGVLYVNGQNFTYNGETKPAYMWFDASNPINNTGHNFVPNFAINGLTGQGIFGGGKIIFNANGGGQLANGKIVWNENGVGNLAGGNVSWDANGNLTIVGDIKANNGTFNGVIKTPYRGESTWYTTLEKGGCILIDNASQGLSLPSWNSLDGVELDIMNNTYQTTFVSTSLNDENGNGIGIVLRHYKLANVRLQGGSRCKLKAIPYIKDGEKYVIWLILNEGNFDIYSLKDYNNNTYYVARDKSITPIPV